MPITMDGVSLGRGTMEGAERSLQAAARKHGPAFEAAYRRAMALDLENDAFARKIITDMMRDEDPGRFLMEVFGDERSASMPFDEDVYRAMKNGKA